MKKSLFLGMSMLAVAGLWTACSNDEVIPASSNLNAISFRVQGSVPTARPNGPMKTNGTGKDHVDAFVVYGTDNSTDFGQANKFIFEGVTVARQQNSENFAYSPMRYFGSDAVASKFFAYSPVNATANGLTVTTSTVASSVITATLNYELPKPSATSGLVTQQDLLVATAKASPASLTTVNLAFDHALSRIFVTAANTTTTDGNVTVKSLKLLNLKNKGDIKITDDGSDISWSWDNLAFTDGTTDTLQYVLADSGVVVPSNTATPIRLTSMEQGMMIIPQAAVNANDNDVFAVSDFALEVVYNMANLKNQKRYIKLKKDYSFEAGKQYSINIVFSGNGINFTIDVNAWEDIVEATPWTLIP